MRDRGARRFNQILFRDDSLLKIVFSVDRYSGRTSAGLTDVEWDVIVQIEDDVTITSRSRMRSLMKKIGEHGSMYGRGGKFAGYYYRIAF